MSNAPGAARRFESGSTVAGRFRILRPLGQGGMGVVYEAQNVHSDERVALKTLLHHKPAALAAFKREFRLAQGLSHPNLVGLHELIESPDGWVFTMDLLEGRTLSSLLQRVLPTHTLSLSSAGRVLGELALRQGAEREQQIAPSLLVPALVDILRGLVTLHRRGLVHRDVKPSNVMLLQDRAVLLDFGLVSDDESLRSAEMAGTLAYMAPELFERTSASPASDLYAWAVLAYEALAGRLPFSGPISEVISQKLRGTAVSLSQLAPATPPELGALLERVLSARPEERPQADELFDVLAPRPKREPSVVRDEHIFVGRTVELDRLSVVLGSAEPRTVLWIEGPSGIGKSALATCFVEGLDDGTALTLTGRCYERESASYKAFDGILEPVRRLVAPLIDALPTVTRACLSQNFPAWFPARASDQESIRNFELSEIRARAFEAVDSLMGELAAGKRLVLFVDDIQWADEESRLLLDYLFRPAARGRCLVATSRTELPVAEAQSWLKILLAHARVERVTLTGLGAAEVRALYEAYGMASVAGEVLQRATASTQGHPLALLEALQNLRHFGIAEPQALDDALWKRFLGLEKSASELVLCVSIANGPLRMELLEAHFRGMGHDLKQTLTSVHLAGLVRTSRSARGVFVEPFHDRVRETVRAKLDAHQFQQLSRSLAETTVAAGRGELALQVGLWEQAGEKARAAAAAREAAMDAERALAFDRAAHFFAFAAERESDPVQRRTCVERHAWNLAQAGHGVEAARVYLTLVDGADGAASRPRYLAGQQLMLAGKRPEGLAQLESIIAGQRTPLAIGTGAILRGVLASRIRTRDTVARATRLANSPDRPPSPPLSVEPDLADPRWAADLYWLLVCGLAFADSARSLLAQCLHLESALATDDPTRLARALTSDAVFLGYVGMRRAAWERTRLAEMLLAQTGDPLVAGINHATMGLLSLFDGALDAAVFRCDQAARVFREECRGVYWERNTANTAAVMALGLAGKYRELGRRVDAAIEEGDFRGDLYARSTSQTSYANLVWLVRDLPDKATEALSQSHELWKRGKSPHSAMLDHIATAHIALYRGEAHVGILDQHHEVEKALKLRGLMRCSYVRLTMLSLRSGLRLQGGRGAQGRGAPDAAVRAQVMADAKAMAADRLVYGSGLADLRMAALASHVQPQVAAAYLRSAERILDTAGLQGHAAAARFLRFEVIPDDHSRQLRGEAEAWFSGEGVRDPERLARMLVPGFRANAS